MMTDALGEELGSGWEGGGPEFRKATKQMGRDGLLGVSWPHWLGGSIAAHGLPASRAG